MKKRFSIYFVIALLGITLFTSKNLSAQTFKPGIFGGITTSQVGGDNYQGFNKLGLTVGGYVRYNIKEKWSVQFELAYVQKGSRNNFSISENDPTQSSEYFLMRLNYIEIPLLFRFNHRKFVYEMGLYYAQLVGLYYEIRSDAYVQQGPYTSLEELNAGYKFQEPVQSDDFGFVIGVGYKLSENVLGSIRYTNSIVPFKKTESGLVDYYPTSLNFGWTNTVIVGTIRYTFGSADE